MLTITLVTFIALAAGWTYRAPGSEGRNLLLLAATAVADPPASR